MRLKNNKLMALGMTLVEVMVAVTILSVSLASVLAVFKAYLKTALANTNVIKATYLVEEGAEAVRLLRDTSWTTKIAPLATGTSFYLSYSTSTKQWSSTTTANKVDQTFYRTFKLAPVYRDANYDIASSGGTLDPNIKYVTVDVAWLESTGSTSEKVSFYLANLF